ncbi:MAG: glycosyltransferase family 4 protein [Nodosilinea sp. LVE1205-7]
MQAYARMVERVLSEFAADHYHVRTINLLRGCPAWPWSSPRWRWRLQQLWLMLTASYQLNRLQVDLIHLLDGSFAHILRGVSKHKTVVITVHDLIPLRQSQGYFPVSSPNQAARFLITQGCGILKHYQGSLCAVSSSTAQDLSRILGIGTPSPVLYLSLRSELVEHKPENLLPWPNRVWHNQRFILHIGNNGFYKNRVGVLKSFAKVQKQFPVRLIIAGAPLDQTLKDQAQSLRILDYFDVYPNPTDQQLARLYEKASLLLFPSYYEGFGWPPLEAMLFGCPVVCSNTGSLPEVVGDAALMAAPDDHSALAQHCLTFLSNPKKSKDFIQRGFKNLERFTEAKMAFDLINFYSERLSHSP